MYKLNVSTPYDKLTITFSDNQVTNIECKNEIAQLFWCAVNNYYQNGKWVSLLKNIYLKNRPYLWKHILFDCENIIKYNNILYKFLAINIEPYIEEIINNMQDNDETYIIYDSFRKLYTYFSQHSLLKIIKLSKDPLVAYTILSQVKLPVPTFLKIINKYRYNPYTRFHIRELLIAQKITPKTIIEHFYEFNNALTKSEMHDLEFIYDNDDYYFKQLKLLINI